MSEGDFEIQRALYDSALYYLDSLIGKFITDLKNRGALDDTILIITGDHGESLGEHGHIDHYYVLNESLLHVPFILYNPSRFGSGSIATQIQTLDLYPTLLKIAGVNPESYAHHQGEILPPIAGHKIREYTYAERFQDLDGLRQTFTDIDLSHLEKHERDRKTVVRNRDYKLIHSIARRA